MRIVERTISKTLNRTETLFVRPDNIDATFRIDITSPPQVNRPGFAGGLLA